MGELGLNIFLHYYGVEVKQRPNLQVVMTRTESRSRCEHFALGLPDDDFLQRINGLFLALVRKQSDIEYCVAYLTKEIGLALFPPTLV